MHTDLPHPPTTSSLRSLLVAALALCVALLPGRADASPDAYGAGSGADGALVLTPGETRSDLNPASALDADIVVGATDLEVDDASAFSVGDLILVWQTAAPSLAWASTTDQSAIDLDDYAAGQWELARVVAIDDEELTVDLPFEKAFRAAGAQVLRVPEFTDVTVPATATIEAPAWDGSTGGAVVFLAQGTVTVAEDGTWSLPLDEPLGPGAWSITTETSDEAGNTTLAEVDVTVLDDEPGEDVGEPDAGFDAGTDVGTDAGNDAGADAGTDAGADAGTDAGSDAGADAGTDAGADVEGDTDELPEPAGVLAGGGPACSASPSGGDAGWTLLLVLGALGMGRRRLGHAVTR